MGLVLLSALRPLPRDVLRRHARRAVKRWPAGSVEVHPRVETAQCLAAARRALREGSPYLARLWLREAAMHRLSIRPLP